MYFDHDKYVWKKLINFISFFITKIDISKEEYFQFATKEGNILECRKR